jgi:S1-C subfamily serine protease
MIHSRRGRLLALGAGVLATGAIAPAAAPTANAVEASSAAVKATASVGNQAAPTGRDADRPYVGARLVRTKDGATVVRVVKGSPAATAGLVKGDVVKSIGSVVIDHKGALREALSGAKAGDKITVVVDHNGSPETLVITLGASQDRPARPAAADVAWAGARLVHVEKKDGVVVKSVAAGGPAATAGIAAGDIVTAIDGTSVTDWQKARKIISSHAPGDKVTVVVDRGGASKTLTMTLGSLDEAVVKSHVNGSAGSAAGA